MGWYIRKSKSAGPFRINLSKSGIGASVGVKGARVSFGPSGTYFTTGSNGLYYREKIGGKKKRKTQNKRNSTFSDSISGSLISILSDNGKESESLNISDSVSRPEIESVDDSKDYVSKRIKRILRLPILLRIVCLVLLSVYIYFNRDTKAIPVAALAGLVFCAIIVPVIRLFSKVSLSYQMDPDQENEWEDFCSALSILNDSDATFMVAQAPGNSVSPLDHTVKSISVLPPNKKSAVFTKSDTESIQVLTTDQQAVFLPDRIIVRTKRRTVNSLFYDSLKIYKSNLFQKCSTYRYRDGYVMTVHWEHETKTGDRDYRFKDNPQTITYRLDTIELLDDDCWINFAVSRAFIIDAVKNKLENYISEYRSWKKEIDNPKDHDEKPKTEIAEFIEPDSESTTPVAITKEEPESVALKGIGIFNSTSPFESNTVNNTDIVDDEIEAYAEDFTDFFFDSSADSTSSENVVIDNEASKVNNAEESEDTDSENDLLDDMFKFFTEE